MFWLGDDHTSIATRLFIGKHSCGKGASGPILAGMSAIELLEKVKLELAHLPAPEREKFFDGLLSLEETILPPQKSAANHLEWPDIHERHRRIFGDRVLPENIVLAAREEED